MTAIEELEYLVRQWRDCDKRFADADQLAACADELESLIPKLEAEIAALNEQIALMLADEEYTQRQYEVDQAVLTEHKAYCNTCLLGRPCQRLEQLEMANRAKVEKKRAK